MPAFGLQTDNRGIATITWDLPGRSMNVLEVEQLDDLEALVDRVLEDPSIKGAVITSGKPDFSGGMDLNVLAGLRTDAGWEPGSPGIRNDDGCAPRPAKDRMRGRFLEYTRSAGQAIRGCSPGHGPRSRVRNSPRVPPDSCC